MQTIKSLLPDYKDALLADGKSIKTWGVYATYYNYFTIWACDVLQRESLPSDMTTPTLRAYLADRAALGVKANTINQEISALSTLCRWLIETDRLSEMPAFKRPRKEEHQRTVPTDTEVYALLDACERFPDKRRGTLARLIVRTFIHTGVRRTELRALTLADFSIERRQVYVRKGKGSKDRRLPICDELAEAHRLYIELRPRVETDALFVVGTLPVASVRLTSLFADLRALSKQGDKPYLQPHGLRHWFACNTYRNMLAAGERDPLRKLQRLLGHVSVQTTERYLIGLGADVDECAAYTGTQRAVKQPERKSRTVVNRKLNRRRY
jgi:integrase